MPLRNPQALPTDGKIAAFDVGSKTYGIATCDPLRLSANPHGTMPRKKWGQDKAKILAFLEQENIACVVVGMPLNMDGTTSASSDRADSFASLLEEASGLPVLLWDERLSTVSAQQALFEQRTGRQTRASKKDVKEHVDSVAAAIFLQAVLEALRQGQGNS